MFNRFSAFEQDFADWRRDAHPGGKPETYQYLDFPSAPRGREARLLRQ